MVVRYNQQSMPAAAPVAQPDDSGGRGLVQIAGQIGNAVQKKIDAHTESLEAAALNDARTKLETQGELLASDLQKDRVAGDGYVPDLQKAREKLKTDIWASVPPRIQNSEKARQGWNYISTNDDIQATHAAAAWQKGEENKYTGQVIESGLNALTARIEQNPDEAAGATAKWREDLKGYSGQLDQETLKGIDDQGSAAITVSAVRGLANTGRYGEAQELIDRVRAAGTVDDRSGHQMTEIVDQARNRATEIADKAQRELDQAHAKAKQQQAEYQRLNASRLETDIIDGKAGRAEIDEAARKGRISENEKPSLILRAREEANARDKASKVGVQIAAGVPLDPYNPEVKTGVDKYWELNGGNDVFGQTVTPDPSNPKYTVNRGTALVLDFAKKAGVAPPSAVSSLQGMAINGTPDQKQLALDTVAQLYEQTPAAAAAAFPEGSQRVLNDALSYKHKIEAGIAPKDALAAVARENEAPTDPVLKTRAAQAAKDAAKLTDGDVKGAVDDNGFWWGGDDLAKGSAEPALAMYRQAYTEAYLRTGDADVAKKQAAADLKRVIGRTKVGSSAGLMAYPPENFYPPALQAAHPGWMNEDLTDAVKELRATGAIGTDKTAEVKSSDLAITSDSQTAREVRSGLPPSYAVAWKGEVLPQRFRFDPNRAIQGLQLKAELDDNEKKRAAEVSREGRQSTAQSAIVMRNKGTAFEQNREAGLADRIGQINRRYSDQAGEITKRYQGESQ